MGGTVHVDHAVLAAAAAAVSEVAAGWTDARGDVGAGVDDLGAGAGELAGSLLDGLHAFEVSWDGVLEVLGASSSAAGRAMTLVSQTTGEIDEALGAP